MKAIRKGSDIIFTHLMRHKRYVFLAILLFVLAIIFVRIVIPALVIVVLGVIATFSTSYKRVIRIPPALELVTFTTVLVSLAYGPLVGIIYAVITSITAEIMTNALDIFIISFVPSRAVIALIVSFIFSVFNGNVVATGIACTIIYNAIAQPFYLFLADVEMRAKSIYFMLLNIGSNIILFVLLGRTAANLLGIP